MSIFGEVTVTRRAYRRQGAPNLYPADGALNLPVELASHGLRRLAAIEATRGSFDDATEAVRAATGTGIGKRQVEALALQAATDIDAFYGQRREAKTAEADVVVLTCDGKGVVMRPEALRKATAAAAAKATPKLAGRVSKGEKRGRKRMAEVGSVYDLTPGPRAAADIFGPADDRADPPPAPIVSNKWLTASVVDDAATVVAAVFDEAERRDPGHPRTWVALVDGNNHQIERITAEAAARNLTVPILIDVIHVLEYLWSAAWSFFPEGDPRAETWVREKATAILEGNASIAAAAIRHKATALGLDPAKRANADRAADYLHAKAPQPRLPDRPRLQVADRHRDHRRRMPPPRQGPHGHHRRPLGTRRCRSDPQTPCRPHQRRLPRLLEPPPRPRTPPTARSPLRQQHHPDGRVTVTPGELHPTESAGYTSSPRFVSEGGHAR